MRVSAVEQWLGLWEAAAGGRAVLINHSENHTFRIEAADGVRTVLRVHRPGYQSAAAIESELEWLGALRRDGMPVPGVIAGRDGRLVQEVVLAGEAPRKAVLFRFEEGREPREGEALAPLFGVLGGLAARLHRHAEGFQASRGFARQVWSGPAILDADGLWGDWRVAPGVGGAVAEVLGRLDGRLRRALEDYGMGRERFGLIHADLRLANLLVDGEAVTLLDFDDCGFCWFAYDFAAAVSFFEDSPVVPELKERWLEAYLKVRPLAAADIAMMDTMLLVRRMALLAWIGSHGETELAQAHAPRFAEGTAVMAEGWLRGN